MGYRFVAAERAAFPVRALCRVAGVAALWITLQADFLAYPGWLAVQKADFILGPIGVGVYWWHRRPGNRLGLLLVVLGLFGMVYIAASFESPWPFGIGVYAEIPLPNGQVQRMTGVHLEGG